MQKVELVFTPSQPGVATCKARNTEGEAADEAQVIISDISEPMQVWGIMPGVDTATGDAVTLTCAASVYTYSGDLNWFLDNVPVESNADLQMIRYQTDYSYRLNLTWNAVRIPDSGSYSCRAVFINNDTNTVKELDMKVRGK